MPVRAESSAAEAFPVGAIFLSAVATDPSALLGYGTWLALAVGCALVTVDSGDVDLDAALKEAGQNSATPSGEVSQPTFTGTQAELAHSGAAVADHASHTHDYSQVVNHTHGVTVTDPGHTHAQASQTATAGGASSWEHGAIDTSSAAAETLPTGSATTGISATTANPAGGVATGTTAGPSAALSHSVTQSSAHTHTPQGTVSQPIFSGESLSVRQKSIAVHVWRRAA